MIVCIESLAVLGAPSPEIKRKIELLFRGPVAGARVSCPSLSWFWLSGVAARTSKHIY